MNEINFFVPLDEIPKRTAQQKGVTIVNGKPHFYTKNNLKDVFDFYYFVFRPFKPDAPFLGQVHLKIEFHYPTKKPHKEGEGKITRPDVDNLAKLPIDVFTKLGFWVDDSQITKLLLTKQYSEQAGIKVYIAEYDKKQRFDDRGRPII